MEVGPGESTAGESAAGSAAPGENPGESAAGESVPGDSARQTGGAEASSGGDAPATPAPGGKRGGSSKDLGAEADGGGAGPPGEDASKRKRLSKTQSDLATALSEASLAMEMELAAKEGDATAAVAAEASTEAAVYVEPELLVSITKLLAARRALLIESKARVEAARAEVEEKVAEAERAQADMELAVMRSNKEAETRAKQRDKAASAAEDKELAKLAAEKKKSKAGAASPPKESAEDDDFELAKLALDKKKAKANKAAAADDDAELAKLAANKKKPASSKAATDDDDAEFAALAARKQSQMDDDELVKLAAQKAKKKPAGKSTAADDDAELAALAARKQSQMDDDELVKLAAQKAKKKPAGKSTAADDDAELAALAARKQSQMDDDELVRLAAQKAKKGGGPPQSKSAVNNRQDSVEEDDDELFKLAAQRKQSQMDDDELVKLAAQKAKKGGPPQSKSAAARSASTAEDDDDELFKLAAQRKQSQMDDDELAKLAAQKAKSGKSSSSSNANARSASTAEDDDELFKLAAQRKQSQMDDDDLVKLAAQKAKGAAGGKASGARPDVMFLYGSETGNSQEICRSMHAEAQEMGIGAKCMSLNEAKFEDLDAKKAPLLVIVTSSTGDGDPPENARKFFAALKSATLPKSRFIGVKFSLLGLGDSMYSTLHNVPKTIAKRLKELGAQNLTAEAYADEQEGLEVKVDPWAEALFDPLQKAYNALAVVPGMTSSLPASAAAKPGAAASKPAGPVKKVDALILFGSESGNSQELARGIQAECPSRNIPAKLMALDELAFAELTKDKNPVVVIVTSSTGEGDPPENARKFYTALNNKALPKGRFDGIQFALLGLGDSMYSTLHNVPKTIAKRLKELGAKTFYKEGYADASEGTEAVSDPWIDGLWDPLKKVMAEASGGAAPAAGAAAGAKSSDLPGLPALPPCRLSVSWLPDVAKAKVKEGPSAGALAWRDPSCTYSQQQPFWAKLQSWELLTADWSTERKVMHIDLDVGPSGMKFHPGDAVGVLPENDPQLVQATLARLGVAPEKPFTLDPVNVATHIPRPCVPRLAFSNYVDITSPARKTLLRVLGEYTSDAAQKKELLFLCTPAGRDKYKEQIEDWGPSLLDLLNKYPSCKPPFDILIDSLQPLAPRLYSLSCSPLACPGSFQAAMAVLDVKTKGGYRKKGVATNWILRMTQDAEKGKLKNPRVACFLRRSGDFACPKTLEKPWVMVGPGTGVTPFRGFLQHRRELLKMADEDDDVGDAWLFFGCRTPEEDYLYREDLEEFEEDGTLTKLELAFSREKGKEKVYVQHRLTANGKAIVKLLVDKGGYFFVCGDGARMAKDLHAALIAALVKWAKMTEAAAGAYLDKMAKEKRYLKARSFFCSVTHFHSTSEPISFTQRG